METTMKNHPFCSSQLKEMTDQLEGCRVRNLSLYHEAASNTNDARDALMYLIRNDEKRRLVFCEHRYESMVESGIKFLKETHRCEKRDWSNMLTPRKGILLHAQCSATRKQTNGVARQKIK
jgi:hypothetical protein